MTLNVRSLLNQIGRTRCSASIARRMLLVSSITIQCAYHRLGHYLTHGDIHHYTTFSLNVLSISLGHNSLFRLSAISIWPSRSWESCLHSMRGRQGRRITSVIAQLLSQLRQPQREFGKADVSYLCNRTKEKNPIHIRRFLKHLRWIIQPTRINDWFHAWRESVFVTRHDILFVIQRK